MRHAPELLTQYAQYHRDRRNIATHFVGVPMIVFGVGVLLARFELSFDDLHTTLAWLVFAPTALWYLTRGSLQLGVAVAVAVGALIWLAHQVSGGSMTTWLGWGLGSFFVGWLIQFVGHWYEGKKPAFVDDIVGLLVGPMFLTAEALFAAGWNKLLLAEVERCAGPTHIRDMAHPA